MLMKRVVIIGPGASGKSTLARQIAEIIGLPVVELDKLFWQPGLVEMRRDRWVDLQQSLAGESAWIMDGNLDPMMLSRCAFGRRIQSSSWISRLRDAYTEPCADRGSVWIFGFGYCVTVTAAVHSL